MKRSLPTHALAAALAALALGAVPAAAQNGERTTLDGVFTVEQARKGETLFLDACALCHAPTEFRGTDFQRTWRGQRVFDLFDRVRTTMPMDAPGRLSRQEYADIIAYILRLNAFPDGETPLPAEDEPLRRIRMEVKPAGH
jgi:S-disulfanyl-L-cysteine oxidoreductase SoxD